MFNLSSDASEMSSSNLSSYSSSFYSVSSNPKQSNEYSHYLQHQQQQDPLQDFIVDVLQNQSLPTYDEGKKNLKKSWRTLSKKPRNPYTQSDMMNRLNSIAPALQYQQQQGTDWSLPCEPEAIPALQNWLEQLSANIQTDENIYPDITVSSASTSAAIPADLLSSDDYDLYPKLNATNMWSSPSPSPNMEASNSISPYHHQNSATSQSSAAHTPPPPPLPPRPLKQERTAAPKYWSPGYIHSPAFNVNAFSSASATSCSTLSSSPTSFIKPSDPIDFSSPPTTSSPNYTNEPNKIFETSVTEASSLTPVYDKASAFSFDNKKELMHMMNVFSSPKSEQKYKQQDQEKEEELKQENEEIKQNQDDEEQDEDEYDSEEYDDDASEHSNDSIPFAHHSIQDDDDNDEEAKSPYADLVGLIKNLHVEDEETIRKRHALLVDQLWKAVSRVA